MPDDDVETDLEGADGLLVALLMGVLDAELPSGTVSFGTCVAALRDGSAIREAAAGLASSPRGMTAL